MVREMYLNVRYTNLYVSFEESLKMFKEYNQWVKEGDTSGRAKPIDYISIYGNKGTLCIDATDESKTQKTGISVPIEEHLLVWNGTVIETGEVTTSYDVYADAVRRFLGVEAKPEKCSLYAKVLIHQELDDTYVPDVDGTKTGRETRNICCGALQSRSGNTVHKLDYMT